MGWGVDQEKIGANCPRANNGCLAALFGGGVGHRAAGLAQVAAHADEGVARAEEAAGKEQEKNSGGIHSGRWKNQWSKRG